MEYIFGTNNNGGVETLRTKGAEHTDLSGFQQVVREFTDCTITDTFHVIRKTRSAEDAEGNMYDWYEIDHHNRNTDKTKLVKANVDLLLVKILEG